MSAKDVCRTCFQSGGTMYPLFDSNDTLPEDSPVFTFIEMLEFFTDIRIPYNDGCPVQLCTDCQDDIHRIYSFILKCRRADAIMKQLKDVRACLADLQEDSNQEKHENEDTENVDSKIVLHENESFAIKEIVEPCSDSMEQPDTVPEQAESLLRLESDRNTMTTTHEIFVDGHLLEVKEEAELDIDENLDQTYSEYPTRTEISNDDRGRDIDLNMMENLFQSHVTDNETEGEEVLWSLNSNEYEKNTQHSELPCPSDSSEIEADYTQACAEFICSECSETFRSERGFVEHMKIHGKKIQQFECELCSKSHRIRYDLRIHMLRVHCSVTGTKHKCDICAKVYSTKAHIKRHMEIHTNDKPFKCEFCMQYYRFETALSLHQKKNHLHELFYSKNTCVLVKDNNCKAIDDNQFPCEVCLENFPTKLQRERHMRIHPPPYTCKICDKNFPAMRYLRYHNIRKHPLDWPTKGEQCDICAKVFALKSELAKHLQRHGAKPFHCLKCRKEYRGQDSFNKHMQEEHGIIKGKESNE